jgi:Fuc2NAc and GlcNAc transferase
MWDKALWMGICAVVVAAALTGWMRRVALSSGLIDRPNERSSHVQPTPRGGGISIVVTSAAAAVFLWMSGTIDWALLAAILVGGVAIAYVGFRDDRQSVSVRLRMAVHVLAAVWAVWCVGGLAPLRVGEHSADLGWVGDLLAVTAIVWAVNLFNFMDGIDGIAASEAAFMTLAAAAIGAMAGGESGVIVMAFVVGAASLGFLGWNWPPARIFMGDVGSGYLGYIIAVLAVAEARENAVAPFVWLILGGIFFVDATITLMRRWARRERVYEAHRTHAYQWLARRWGSHKRVTVAIVIVNFVWLLPSALLAARYPAAAGWITCAALAVVAILTVACGAGRRETNSNQGLPDG